MYSLGYFTSEFVFEEKDVPKVTFIFSVILFEPRTKVLWYPKLPFLVPNSTVFFFDDRREKSWISPSSCCLW